MSITRRNFLEYVVASAAVGCSGESGSAQGPTVPSIPTPTSAPKGGAAGAAGQGANRIAQFGSVAGAAGAVGSEALSVAGSSSGQAIDKQPIVPIAAAVGSIKGHLVTKPALAAKHGVVYLVNAPIGRVVDAKIDDRKLNFIPHVAMMTVGGTLTYVNHHPFADSAFSGSNNDKWDFGMVEPHGVRKRKFEKAGHYTLLCHIHPNQLGFLIVSPSSYFAQVDPAGNYLIQDVPAGSYDLVAWAPRMQPETRTISVAEGETTADFELKR